MEDIFAILDKLLKMPKEYLHYALIKLMIEDKIDFIEMNKVYVEYLEMQNKDKALKLSDANSCTLSLLMNFKKENKHNHADIHWALYNLNESKQFQMDSLNEKFNYNKEEDCKFSFYYRDKHNK
ncbi:MAG: hypothetical protein MJZ41_07755 [Bacteroidaceae bacterium]|nr:hypothetical protein [Bacteroidaceae bacterium]